jgi:hypothetical protein
MATLENRYEKERKNLLKQVDQLSANNLLKQQFEATVKKSTPPASDLQQRAETNVASYQAARDINMGQIQDTNPSRVGSDPPQPSQTPSPSATPTPTPTPSATA